MFIFEYSAFPHPPAIIHLLICFNSPMVSIMTSVEEEEKKVRKIVEFGLPGLRAFLTGPVFLMVHPGVWYS